MFALVVLAEDPMWKPTSVLAASVEGAATVWGLPSGENRLKAIRVDAAENANATEVVALVPAGRACSVAPVVPLVLLASTLLRRRRVRLRQ